HIRKRCAAFTGSNERNQGKGFWISSRHGYGRCYARACFGIFISVLLSRSIQTEFLCCLCSWYHFRTSHFFIEREQATCVDDARWKFFLILQILEQCFTRVQKTGYRPAILRFG